MRLLHFLTVFAGLTTYALAVLTEQRCYYAPGQLAPAEIIPCYTDQAGEAPKNASCCKFGSKCTEQGACWDGTTGVTYQYGCTDSTYTDGSCPRKCGLDTKKSHWIGMVWCGNTWCCHHPDNCKGDCVGHDWDPLIEKLPKVDCKDVDVMKYKAIDNARNPLSDMLFLPDTERKVQVYLGQHPIGTSSSSSSASASTVPSPIASTNTSSPPSSSPSDMASTGGSPFDDSPESDPSKGTAIGLGMGIPAAIALVGVLIFYLRRKYIKRCNDERGETFNFDKFTGHPVAPVGMGEQNPGGHSNVIDGCNDKPELDGSSTTDRPLSFMYSPGAPPTELDNSTVDGRSIISSPINSPALGSESLGGNNGVACRNSRVSSMHQTSFQPRDGTIYEMEA